ncbi:hypothetical protein RchiOBHm_Chr1g0317801 [Rosa chinensis]|uniref:Uncharacterized protein n=1 Tax=Rosa chinensis TaxID=74649 RepID=A0A2P6S834_ROSCH|nr:hypothetical protein RchiOBHm_Chr1g0317801 [Rosa chinensis]
MFASLCVVNGLQFCYLYSVICSGCLGISDLSLATTIFDFRFLALLAVGDIYLAGTVMLIFGMGLYGLFISNVPNDVPSSADCSVKGSSLFGMFALKVIFIPFPASIIGKCFSDLRSY